ncbi:MAG: hypothetical protein HYU66_03645 [Armatimonadetes bacterium]|nr:hypothetical protein [Armatimonadota bacterium]
MRHQPARTAVGLMADLRMDPGDWLLAELELWPHTAPLTEAECRVPRLISGAR